MGFLISWFGETNIIGLATCTLILECTKDIIENGNWREMQYSPQAPSVQCPLPPPMPSLSAEHFDVGRKSYWCAQKLCPICLNICRWENPWESNVRLIKNNSLWILCSLGVQEGGCLLAAHEGDTAHHGRDVDPDLDHVIATETGHEGETEKAAILTRIREKNCLNLRTSKLVMQFHVPDRGKFSPWMCTNIIISPQTAGESSVLMVHTIEYI